MARRRIIGAVTALVLFAGIGVAVAGLPPGGTFTDDDGNTHEGNIEAIVDAGVTLGCNPEGTLYCPADNVTRGQMASFLARAFALPASMTDWFTDDDGNTHEDNINAVADAGITLGFGDGTYQPNGTVTREQMGSFIARALGLAPIPGDVFDDVSGTHEPNVNAIADAGVTLGCNPEGTLYCPTDNVRRDQMASFIARALGLDPIIPPPPTTTTTTLPTTGDLNITGAQFDAPGNDNDNPNGEWVDIRNDDAVTVDMTGWRLEDEGPAHTYNFPDGFTLAPGITVRVFVGVGTDTATSLYWGLSSAVWNNGGDTASLFDSGGNLVDSLSQ